MLDHHLVLPHTIAAQATQTPDQPAMLDAGGRRASFAELEASIYQWATALGRLGVGPGQTVYTMMPNSFESYYVWLGLSWLRAIEVPANTMYRGAMLEHVLNDSKAQIAVISERFLDRVAEVAANLKHLKTVMVPDATGPLPPLPFEMLDGGELETAKGASAPGDGPAYYDVSAMIYTSGTTGPSKGVLVPWAELFEFSHSLPPDLIDPGRAMYSTYPAFHVSGKALLYIAAVRQAHLVIRESFSLSAFWDDIRTFDCVSVGLLGPMAAMLMFTPPKDDDADNPVKTVYMGPLIPQIDEFKKRFGVVVGTGFGMTEVGVPIASDGFNLANGQSCGRRRTGPPGYQVRIVDEHDETVPIGTVGELVVRADEPWVINSGYWGLPDKTAEAWRNGWFHTGDGFREDEEGNLYFVDRMKDAIRRRGENISSFEVEAGVNAHPAVQESAVVAVPSELGEDDVKAVIVLAPGAALDPAELIEFLVPRMPQFMIPRYIEIVDSLPKTDATQRTQKVHLRAAAVNDRTWDREKTKK